MDTQAIHEILQSYRGVNTTLVNVAHGDEVIITAFDISQRQMAFAATKILNRFPELIRVNFVGDWHTWIFNRRTLASAGHKIRQ